MQKRIFMKTQWYQKCLMIISKHELKRTLLIPLALQIEKSYKDVIQFSSNILWLDIFNGKKWTISLAKYRQNIPWILPPCGDICCILPLMFLYSSSAYKRLHGTITVVTKTHPRPPPFLIYRYKPAFSVTVTK